MTSLKRAIQTSIINLWRNRFISVATILVIAILLFIFNTILVVHFTAQQELKGLAQKIDLIVYLDGNIEEKNAQEMTQYISRIEGVTKVGYIPKEVALGQFLKAHPKTAEYYKKFNLENTLPSSIRVTVVNPEFYEKVENNIEKSQYASLITNFTEDQNEENITTNIIHNLKKVSTFTRYLLYWVIIAFLLGGILMIYNAIHLHIYNRRMEISIMNLVGAGQKFIQLPYLLEGLWISLIALAVSIGLFLVVSEGTILGRLEIFTGNFEIPYLKFFTLEALAIIGLNLIASFCTVYRHTKSQIFA